MNTQWHDDSGRVRPCGPTRDILLPGAYDVGGDMKGVYFSLKTIVHDQIIDLPGSSIAPILTRIDKFWKSRDRYEAFGYIYKTGILVHGRPGGGKTMMINLLNNRLIERGGVVLYASDLDYLTSGLCALRSLDADRRLIVVLEDIDQLIESDGEQAVTALLDGENQIAGVVYLATTNTLSALPDKIRQRPSRFDLVVEMQVPFFDARLHYLKRNLARYVSDAELQKWASMTSGFSVADLKELVIAAYCLDQDPLDVIQRLRSMSNIQPVTEELPMTVA